MSAVFRKTDIAVMKDFITSCEDLFRLPYASQMTAYLRRFVLGASANSRDFLREPDGNRRFWIININHKIDTDALEAQREDILKAALILRANGERIYLSDEEQEINNQRNMEYVDIPLLEEIELVINGAKHGGYGPRPDFSQPFLTTEIETSLKNTFSHLMVNRRHVRNALLALGYRQKDTYRDKQRGKYWIR